MNKKKIIGLVMVIVGAAYMAGLFTFTEQFEIINDNLAYVLTMISSVMIFLGIGMLMLKTPAERQIEQEALAEESVKVNQYYVHKAYVTPILIGINVLVFGAVNLLQGDEAVLKFAISKYDYAFYKLFT
ncbi:MAG: hypothetical protein K6G11_00860, partial [Lachnospiraceae bacterium]|nr:hypothetical protein [Lachnospiraceae bacterium]